MTPNMQNSFKKKKNKATKSYLQIILPDFKACYEAEANGNSPCILALRNPWTEEPAGLQFMG